MSMSLNDTPQDGSDGFSGFGQPIIFRNQSSTTFLLDIPTSISASQELDGIPRRRLISSEPISHPFVTPEPKSEAALRKIKSNNFGDEDLHETYVQLITDALAAIRKDHGGSWCHPRCLASSTNSKKRSAYEAGLEVDSVAEGQSVTAARSEDWPSLDRLLKTLSAHEDSHFNLGRRDTPTITYDPPTDGDPEGYLSPPPRGSVLRNYGTRTMTASISSHKPNSEAHGSTSTRTFCLPPRSVAVLADCNDAVPLRAATRALAKPDGTRRRFDLILLDPPWPNRSARRAGRYSTVRGPRGIRQLLLGLDLDAQLTAGGWIAIWVTNSRSARDAVLGRQGLFEALDARLAEEWVWAKATTGGECVSALHGAWRRPYEVLLVGRPNTQHVADEEVRRRVVVAVPDLHSRKPCLKQLFGELLFGGEEYRALEVFARYAVAGWWSWGDEVIKFNWEGCWRS